MSCVTGFPPSDDDDFTLLLKYVKNKIDIKNEEIKQFIDKWGYSGVVSAYMDKHNILKYEDAGGAAQPPRKLPNSIINFITIKWNLK